MHACPLEAGTDGNFAASLHYSSRSAETLGMKFSVAHALLILFDVVDTFACRLTIRSVAMQSSEERSQPAIVEFLMPPAGPRMGLLGVGPVDGFCDITQVFLHVIAIDDLEGTGKQFLGNIPDVGGSVSQHNGSRRCARSRDAWPRA